jgi:hypothetical protein
LPQTLVTSSIAFVVRDGLILPCRKHHRRNSLRLSILGQTCDGNALTDFCDMEVAAFRNVDVANEYAISKGRYFYVRRVFLSSICIDFVLL